MHWPWAVPRLVRNQGCGDCPTDPPIVCIYMERCQPMTSHPHVLETASAAESLSGLLLAAYLDQVGALLQPLTEGAQVTAEQLSEAAHMLSRHPLQAGDIDTLYRIYQLWLYVEQPARALQLIQAHADLPARLTDADERYSAEFDLASWRLYAAEQAGDRMQAVAQLRHAAQLLAAQPLTVQTEAAWEYLCAHAHELACWEIYTSATRARRELQRHNPQRQACQAWDDAVAAARLGLACLHEGQAESAVELGHAAMHHLLNAGADQHVDHRDWLNLAPVLQQIAPGFGTTVIEQVRRLAPEQDSPALARDLEVRLARIQARQLHAQGQISAALEAGWQGRVLLVADENDDSFNSQFIDWLLAAGELTQAAALNVDAARTGSTQAAGCASARAREQLAQGSQDPSWALALCAALESGQTDWLEQDGRCADEAFQYYLALARRQAPGNLLADQLEGVRLANQDEYARALPLLEWALADAQQFTAESMLELVGCRARLLGVEQAVQMPVPELACAGRSYYLASQLAFYMSDRLDALEPGGQISQTALQALRKQGLRILEGALQRFESFFECGQGHLRDGNVHVYSKLCNNLGILYASYFDQPERAVPLHHKGLAASAFAEHYWSLMRCHERLDQDEEYVEAAETLWRFTAEGGYDRTSPLDYINKVCIRLLRLDRDIDIPFWMQRQEQWWNAQSAQEQEDSHEYYVSCVVACLSCNVFLEPDDALVRLERLMPMIDSSGNSYQQRVAGLVYMNAGRPQLAEPLFHRAIEYATPHIDDDPDQAEIATLARDNLEELRSLTRKKVWWKFW